MLTAEQQLHSEVVRRACALVGAISLADQIHVSRALLEKWAAGIGRPPPRVFFRLVHILRRADPECC
jgi:hypothetical protein